MIPTMIVFGMVFGYWWRAALIAAPFLWPLLLVELGGLGLSGVPVAAVLGLLNAAVGVAAIQGGLWAARRLRLLVTQALRPSR